MEIQLKRVRAQRTQNADEKWKKEVTKMYTIFFTIVYDGQA